ncbi:dissimilatory-type sulfite reductase subunit alpha [Dehalobacterium formicoaceticum]|uniref:Dissimilatory-type sulfite reductase subunit alpha n=1 Tax=Dehalobacterium formicoaceticum TaxID=51515 RepID=A0ABT1Y1X9_9FIRM|nr:dissimilatory-type sulfite reductase subunit alpha [Dehalobacterium formicoaceticum]MCR6544880.1 dissimilatory-type sulfite reductase subunit alpha [Dehalobacterium formicoaceticum]
MTERKTPMLDELEKGPWPSFVTDLKRAAEKNDSVKDLIAQLEQSYEEKKGHWKHGGIVGVRGYGAGVIGRYSDEPEKYPNIAEFHTLRINSPAGWFYDTKTLRNVCDMWEEHGSGLLNLHGTTGDIILLGTKTNELQPTFDAFSDAGFDLGGSGSGLRSPSACCGPARCEWACYDTLDVCDNLTHEYQDEMHRPMWPYKFKFKFSGCPNDCVASIARSDLSVIGTWRDTLRINQEEIKNYANSGMDIQGRVCEKCPTKALTFNSETKELFVKAEDCTRCMHCINVLPKAVRPGKEKGATLMIGGKSTILRSAFLSWVIVPFMPLEAPYTELKDLIARIWEWWDEHGKTRERIGELIYRLGMGNFLRAVDLPPVPQMVKEPRANPYIFWQADEVIKADEATK